ncbi:hypothetical protein FKW77_008416 [Venturia effusa]|uniref:BTB domain-containing protein n=1 Tax=Venturia effusa TaxID=50376 RepID=A0A517L1T4_9PEZI|nr:hypothetical protein FKW77_008416 [Venturia effusa]
MDFAGFPLCHNGDVLIVLSNDNRLQLHAEILKRHSKFFKGRITQQNAATLSSGAQKQGETVRWRFDLLDKPDLDGEGAGRLVAIDLDSSAKPLDHQRLATADYSGRTSHPLYATYMKVLSSFYSRPFDIEEHDDMGRLLSECVALIDVSEYLGCVHSVSHTINAALLGQGQILFRSIASIPSAWVSLALRVRSVSVLIESIVHLTGQWNKMTDNMKGNLDPKVRELCQKKHEELQQFKKTIECKVLKFYPLCIQREVGAPPSQISRMSYSNDIMQWMTLCLFRHWFATCLALDRHRHSEDGGYWLYSRLAKGGPAYLGKTELKSYHEKFPMSTRGENVLEGHMEELKKLIVPLVKPLMKNESQLDCERFPVDYTTCIKVTRDDCMDMWDDDVDAPEWARMMPPPGGRGMMKPPQMMGHMDGYHNGNGTSVGTSHPSRKRARQDDAY